MNESLLALIGFCAWAMLLAVAIAAYRLALILLGKFAMNGFPSGTPHGPDRYWRLNRAHLNALETLPIFAALVLTAQFARVAIEPLACVVLFARIAQSIFHIASNAPWAVAGRFVGFATQLGAMACIIGRLVMARA